MVKSEGIPKEVIDEIDIKKKNKIDHEVNVLVESHQVKIPLPKSVRLGLKLEKGAKCILSYDAAKKEVVCRFK